jgi:putative MATE family efflux protein
VTTVPPRRADVADPLVRGSQGLAVLRLGLPMACGLASHALVNLVDLVLVGRLGAAAIEAAHIATTLNILPMIVGNCISVSLLSQLSRRLGEGDGDGARALHRRAEWGMLWLALAVAVVTAAPAGVLVDLTGTSAAVRDEAVHYLVVSNLGCVPMFVLMQATAAMRAAAEVLVPLLLLLFANALNLALDVVLLFGWDALSIEPVGVTGAAYATVAARAAAAVLALAWLRRRRHPLSLRACPRCGERAPAVLRALVGEAWPQALQLGLRAGLVEVLTVVVRRGFGEAPTVALGIATRLDTIVLFAAFGFANAATILSGRSVVVAEVWAARSAGLWAGLQAALFGAAVVLLLQANATTVAAWFLPTAGPEVVEGVRTYLGVAAWAQAFAAAALGAIGAVHGAGRMRAPLVVDLVGFAVLGALLLRAVAAGESLRSIYGAVVVGSVLVAVLHAGFVVFGRWTEPPAAPRPDGMSG